MRKTVVLTAIVLIVFLMELITQEAVVVKANPYFMWRTIPTPSDAIPPSVTMLTPQNNTLYYSAEIAFNFIIAPPKWTSIYDGHGYVDSLSCTLDDNLVDTSNFKNNYTNGIEQGYNVAFTVHGLPVGNHSLQISADGVYLIDSSNDSHTFGTKFWVSGSSTIYFTTDTIKKEQTSDNATLTTIVALTLGILAVASVLAVVTYRKRKATK